MAITYLSGERIQGILGEDVAAVVDYVNDAFTGSLHIDSIGGYKDYIGVQVATGHAAVGTIFSSFTFWAWADQSPDGKIGLQIVTPPASGTGLGTIKGTSVTTVEANTITTTQPNDGSGTPMTFTAPLDSSGNAITIADGDVITLYDVEGTINTSDGGQIQPVMGTTAISNQQKLAWNSGGGSAGWVTYSSISFKWKGTKALIPAVDEKETITDVPAGTRYEETDTRKIFQARYDGVDTTISWYEKGTSGGGMTQFSYTRGLHGGGRTLGSYPSAAIKNVIDYITISTTGNSTDFGDLSVARAGTAGMGSTVRAVWAGGNSHATGTTFTNIMDYVTTLTTGNAADFGDLNYSAWLTSGTSNLTRGVASGGRHGTFNGNIDYITMDTTGNATDFGDLTGSGRGGTGSCSDLSRGIWAGGYSPSNDDTIDYITIATLGNATDFGNLSSARTTSGLASATRGCFFGDSSGSTNDDIIDYITIQTTGNASDFGDLSVDRAQPACNSNQTRGTMAGGSIAGENSSNVIDYITIATTGNATDFGDLTEGQKRYPTGVSG